MDWFLNFLLKVAVLAPPILMALTVHEASHGLVAWLRGDPTAKLAGRLSLNPLRHLDPTGTLVFFITAWIGAGIGWAKPVPVDYANLKNPRKDGMLISAAGPAANLVFALALAGLVNSLIDLGMFRQASLWKYYLFQMFEVGVYINVILALFNLIPLPPLDGSGILAGLLSPQTAYRYQQLSRYGFMILLALIFLPSWIPAFPDLITYLVILPARLLMAWLLPVTAG